MAALACASVLSLTVSAAAQFELNRYQPGAATADGFALARPIDQGSGRFGAQLQLNYANDPLIWNTDQNGDDGDTIELVTDQLVAHAIVSLGLAERVLLFVALPVNLVLEGSGADVPGAPQGDGTSLGDPQLGARVRILGEADDPFALGAQITLALPAASWVDDDAQLAGDSSVRLGMQLLAELRVGRLRAGASAGFSVREGRDVGDTRISDELDFVLGPAYRVLEGDNTLELMVELFGTSVLSDLGARENTALELLAGVKWLHADGFAAGLAGGSGLTHGYGAPFYRLIAMFGFASPGAPSDSDGDGIADDDDRCPERAEDRDSFEDEDGCPDPDNDRDGIFDRSDECPAQAEDKDHFEDDDGCPDPDNDRDGIPDASDHCSTEAEDKDGFADEDGCPDPDNDRDQVLDGSDKCPTDAEDEDGFEDEDGCPDPDNDHDEVPDSSDQCPLEAETRNGSDDEDGCPDLIRVDRRSGRIQILKEIHFATASDRILPASFAMLEEMSATLSEHAELGRIAIEGHTDAQGAAAANLKLSQRRAESVRRFLIEHGVPADRMTATGYGETRPLRDNATAEGRALNRRVEFNLSDFATAAPEGGAATPAPAPAPAVAP